MFTLGHCPTSYDTVSCPHVRTVPVTTSKQRMKVTPTAWGCWGKGFEGTHWSLPESKDI